MLKLCSWCRSRQPSKDQLLTLPPPAPSPGPENVAPPPASVGGSGKKWVFAGVGIGVGAVILGVALAWYNYCWSCQRERKLLNEMPIQQEKKVDV